MNVHVPQSHESQSELNTFMTMDKLLLNEMDGSSTVSLIMDAVLVAYWLSNDQCRLSTATFNDFAFQVSRCYQQHHETSKTSDTHHPSTIARAIDMQPDDEGHYSGYQALSLLFPTTFTYHRHSVKIDDGHFIHGRLTKKTLGRSKGAITHCLSLYHGERAASAFLSVAGTVLCWLAGRVGFTMGICNTIVGDESLRQRMGNAIACMGQYIEGEAKRMLAKGVSAESVEIAVKDSVEAILPRASSMVLDSVDNGRFVNDENGLIDMITCGSKGSLVNLGQMCSTLGQMSLNGQRIHTHTGGAVKRTLPNQSKPNPCHAAVSLKDAGFIRSSLRDGLTPSEFFFSAQSGRQVRVRRLYR